MRYLLAIAVLGMACGGSSLKRTGEGCTASSECDSGLVCDLNASPHVCAAMGSVDAPIVVDAPRVDGHPHDGQLVDARPIDARPIDAPPDAPPDAAVDAPTD